MSKFENLSPGNRESFYSWIEAAPIPIMLYDETGEIIEVSRAWTDITGYTRIEIPTVASWIDRVIVDGKDAASASLRTLFQLRTRQHKNKEPDDRSDYEFFVCKKSKRNETFTEDWSFVSGDCI